MKTLSLYYLLAFSFLTVSNGIFFSSKAVACTQNDLRYSQTSKRVYISNGAICTPSEINILVPAKYSSINTGDVIEQLSPGVWLLKTEMRLEDGATLRLYGTILGGDTDTFLMLSDNTEPAYHVKIQAIHGNVDIRSTHVTTWDPQANGPDTLLENGRAFIHINSMENNGVALESRMDIIDSEISYLGFYDSESYGLVWKVRGGKYDHSLYDRVEVYGSIINSYIHHNYMGMYSYGAFGLVIDNNEVAFNASYGIDPHDDSDELVITNNDVHDNGNHGIICSRRCDDLIITDNVSYRNRHGIMLHRDTNNTLVENNTVYDNRDNGIAVFESHYNIVRNNTVYGNRHGIRLSLGSHDNLIENNIIENNSGNGIYQYSGSDAPETTNGRPANNTFTNNTVRNNGRLVKFRDSDGVIMTDNIFEGITDIEIYDSTAIQILSNAVTTDAMEIRLDGTEALPADTLIEIDEDTSVKVTPFATVNLFNRDGRLLDAEEHSDTLSLSAVTDSFGVTSTHSMLTVTSGMIGSSSYIAALPIWITLDSGAATVSRLTPGINGYSWRMRAPTGTANATIVVGNLIDNQDYTVLKDLQVIATVTAINNSITVTDQIDTHNADYVVQPAGTAIDISVAYDSYVLDGMPDNNYGSATTLETKISSPGYIRTTFMAFNIDELNAPVSNATIAVTAALSRSGSVITEVYGSDASWIESTLTWNNQPTISSVLGGATISGDNFQIYTIDITAYINQLIAANATFAGVAFINPEESTAVTRIRSRESGTSSQPVLRIIP